MLTSPGDAYKYFQGEPIKHPMGFEVKIETPLDWAGVTDHSEYAGVVNMANEPGSAVSKLPEAQPLILKAKTKEEMERVALYAINTLASGPPVKALMAPEIAGTVWKRNVALADQANQPGKFTAFCSYEWTSMPSNMNLHRNIFFKDCAKVPAMPFSAMDSKHPVDLWNWMDGQRKAGNELLAISHNANLSDGRMFPTEVDTRGRPIDAAYAASRTRNEPLIEIKQLKGTSETHPLLSPNDEFASFEIDVGPARQPAGPHPAHRRQLRPAGAQGRPRHAGQQGFQPVQVRLRCRRRTRTTPPCPTARTISSAAIPSPTGRSKHACPASSSAACSTRAPKAPRADRRVGRGEHARLDLRGACSARRPSR